MERHEVMSLYTLLHYVSDLHSSLKVTSSATQNFVALDHLQKLYINGLRFRGIRNILNRNRVIGLKPSALKIVDPKEVSEKTVENLDLFAREVKI